MKDYLFQIIVISILVGVWQLISPDSASTKKYTKMIGMLVVLCVMISPMETILKSFDKDLLEGIKDSLIEGDEDKNDDYSGILNEYLTSFSIQEYKKAIQEILLKEFKIPIEESEIEVFTVQSGEHLSVSNIQILLLGKSIFKNPYEIEKRISSVSKCECIVLIKER